MRDSDAVFPDDVPVADALEQRQVTADFAEDDDDGDREAAAPLESPASDWQEQRETVLVDPEFEEPEQ